MVLLVVDTQDMNMTEDLYAFDNFVQNVKNLISSAREKNIEIIYIRHDDGSVLTAGANGFEIFSQFAPRDGEKIFDKNFNSAFRNTGLLEYLLHKKEHQVMIVGLQTDYCIDATVKCGFEHGFKMIVPAYCNTTCDNEFMSSEKTYQYYNQKIWNNRYAECVTFEEALAML